ncbi:SDR family oxidoreductase [Cuneatibacter sp. NSJ-177]|uniref:SDR family oxidoreductase n=1 Tax=Cuneatibacter sp. NSJ-177 TaxID=2931401 RepID=UPI001FD3AADF|nr:SDR family oxidoreductase [Cuneatibacter sp. NSJ-177]MCJ7836270.1 SDR family oxidoreductase [Cuneatibacter sp. NSJ-177]
MKQVTVITGGAGGMGFATANIFGRQGETLLLCDVKEDALETSAAILRRQNMEVYTAVVDVGRPDLVQAAAQKADSLGRIHNIVHTAGLSPILVADLPDDSAGAGIMRVNGMGTVHMVEAFYPLLKEGASMVCFTSSAAYLMPQIPEPMLNVFNLVLHDREHFEDAFMKLAKDGPGRAYMFGKLFVLHYVRMNAGRFGHKGCRINSIAPGRIVTPMHRALIDKEPERIEGELATMPLGRYGSAYEIGNLAEFLCSYRASYLNGIDILMDDGTQAFTSTPQLPD